MAARTIRCGETIPDSTGARPTPLTLQAIIGYVARSDMKVAVNEPRPRFDGRRDHRTSFPVGGLCNLV